MEKKYTICICTILFFQFLSACSSDTSNNSSYQIDYGLIAELRSEIENGTYGEIHSFLIQLDGNIVEESYFNGYSWDQLYPLHSVSKSVTSILIGIALQNNEIQSTNETVLSFFPEYDFFHNMDSLKESLILEDLLTMRAGFEWDGEKSPGSKYDKSTEDMVNSDDWIKYVLDLKMAHAPGSTFMYCNGATTLLSGIITNQTGFTAEEYAFVHLFSPLSIQNWEWETGPNDLTATAWGLSLRPKDMVNLGQLVLNNGKWGHDQVVPESWVSLSTSSFTDAGDYEYGYSWWRFPDDHRVVEALEINDIYFAWGRDGQFIFVVPHLRLVVVSTALNSRNNEILFNALTDYVFPAVLRF